MAADVLAYRAHEVPSRGGGPARARRAYARRQRFDDRLSRVLVVPEARIPRSARASATSKSPSARSGPPAPSERAPSACSTSRTRSGASYGARIAELRAPRIVRRRGQPRISNLIEIMAVTRGTGPEAIEREFDGSGYGDFKTAVADAVVGLAAARCAAPAEELPRRSGRAQAVARPAPTMLARLRRHARRRARGDGRRPAASLRPRAPPLSRTDGHDRPSPGAGPRRLRRAVRPVAVAGPARGAGPARWPRSYSPTSTTSTRRGRARYGGRDRVPGADRGVAGAGVAVDAAGRGAAEDLEGLGPEEAAEELLERMLRALPPRRRLGGRGARRGPRVPAPVGAPAAAAAPGVGGSPSACTTPRSLGQDDRLAAAHAAADRPAAAIEGPHVSGGPARSAAAAAGPRRFSFDEAVEGADRVTVAVTLFALLELYKRGEAASGAARARRPITIRAEAADGRGEAAAVARSRGRSRRSSSSRPSRSRSRSWRTLQAGGRAVSGRGRRAGPARSKAAASCCARSPAARRWPRRPDAEEAPRVGCWRARARRR